jgi:Flp pilus assembly protein TadD
VGRRCLIGTWVVLLWAGSLAWGADRPALRELSKLPTLTFDVGVSFSFSRGRGLRLWWDFPDHPAEIAALQESLKGDPWDAERVHRIGELAREMGDDARAARAFERAVALYRERLKTQPGSGLLMASLGQALGDLGKTEEAEKTLREAARIAPKEWRCWMLLAQLLENQALALLTGPSAAATAADEMLARAFAGIAPAHLPQPAELDRVERLLDEARDTRDRAVAIAMQATQGNGPGAARAHAERGTSRGFTQALLRGVLAQMRGQKVDPRQEMLSPASLADFRRAADLDPGSVELVALAGLCEVFGFALAKGPPWEAIWPALPEESKARVRRAMDRLGRLGQAKDARAEAAALDALGMVAYVASEEKRAEECLRRAVKRDPSRARTWEMLAMILGAGGRYEELVTWCKERLAYRDTLRTRLLLAKAYEKLGKLALAEEQVRAAAALAPNDFYVSLGCAALLMRQSEATEALAEADGQLARAERACAAGCTLQQWVELALTRAIHLGLSGEEEKARGLLAQCRDRDPGNEEVRQALAALGGDGKRPEKRP